MINRFVRNKAKAILRLSGLERLYDLLLASVFQRLQEASTNPLHQAAFTGFSQNDEDGITLEILRRINAKSGSFIEFGVESGHETNTIILLALGWRGSWFGGEPLGFKLPEDSRLRFKQCWITLDNIVPLAHEQRPSPDLISLDLDGNDYHFAEALLDADIRPKVFIVEYNGKFPPPSRFVMPYDAEHAWRNDDYFGASLQSLAFLFERFSYHLVACNLSGANAFFVRSEFRGCFEDVPRSVPELYRPPYYFLRRRKQHPTSSRTVLHLTQSSFDG